MGDGWWERRIPDYGDASDPAVRARYGYLEGYVSIAGNVLLFAVKVVLGLFIGSIALLADGVHSLSDVATSAVVLVGFRMASKPPDVDHPFGHGRVEYIATLVIAVLLAITGLEFIITSLDELGDPAPLENEKPEPPLVSHIGSPDTVARAGGLLRCFPFGHFPPLIERRVMTIKEELELIAERNNGTLPPGKVVAFAKRKSRPQTDCLTAW